MHAIDLDTDFQAERTPPTTQYARVILVRDTCGVLIATTRFGWARETMAASGSSPVRYRVGLSPNRCATVAAEFEYVVASSYLPAPKSMGGEGWARVRGFEAGRI